MNYTRSGRSSTLLRKKKNSKYKFSEDRRIIGTDRYDHFQKICSTAGLLAIREAKTRGLPITYVKNGKIIKEYPNGKKEILGRIKPDVKVKRRLYKIH